MLVKERSVASTAHANLGVCSKARRMLKLHVAMSAVVDLPHACLMCQHHVRGQAVLAGEGCVAHRAGKGLLERVLRTMGQQPVPARKHRCAAVTRVVAVFGIRVQKAQLLATHVTRVRLERRRHSKVYGSMPLDKVRIVVRQKLAAALVAADQDGIVALGTHGAGAVVGAAKCAGVGTVGGSLDGHAGRRREVGHAERGAQRHGRQRKTQQQDCRVD